MAVNYNAEPLLKVEGLKQYFRINNNYKVKAVENVSFEIYPGETDSMTRRQARLRLTVQISAAK